ncbi:ABC transporter permease [candidate division KSB1 bacterium]
MNRNYIKPPKIAEWLLSKVFDDLRKHNTLGDFAEYYIELTDKKGKLIAWFWYWSQLIRVITGKSGNIVIWSMAMFRNYLKIALRNIFKQKIFSFINISGLAIGIACCVFIYLYIDYETSWDSYHNDTDRIYRIISSIKNATGTTIYAGVAAPLMPYLKENFPQIEYGARLWPIFDVQVKYKDRLFKEEAKNVQYADNDIFKIFKIPFIAGDYITALERPFTVVITDKTADKYFGDEDPLGKILRINDEDYEVTGITYDIPGNSILQFNILRSWGTITSRDEQMVQRWYGGFHMAIVKLEHGVDKKVFTKGITQSVVDHSRDILEQRQEEFTAILQPVTDIHLHSNGFVFDNAPHGNILYIYVLSCIGIFIFLIACFNFINLSTARSGTRACEVGIRKVAGAHRRQLLIQFISETLIIAVVSFAFASSAVIFKLSTFNNLTSIKIAYSVFLNTDFIFIILLIITFVGIIAGSYPALFLSSFKPVNVLRRSLRMGIKSGNLRKVLVIGQFVLSVVMISGAIIFDQQVNYMKGKPLGFDKEQKLIIRTQGNGVNINNYNSIKEEFLNISSVTGAAFSSSVPGEAMFQWLIWPTGQEKTNPHLLNVMSIDEDFFSVYDLKLIAGGDIDEIMENKRNSRGYILNETAVITYGWKSNEEAMNKTLMDYEPYPPVLGVFKDYHFEGLQNVIGPQAFGLRLGDRYLTLKFESGNIRETLNLVEQKYNTLFPDRVFDYYFLDDDLNSQYKGEEQIAKIFRIFTFLGIFIACLGLFGLAAFMAEQRTKEIGIRKTLGASVSNCWIIVQRIYYSGNNCKYYIMASGLFHHEELASAFCL